MQYLFTFTWAVTDMRICVVPFKQSSRNQRATSHSVWDSQCWVGGQLLRGTARARHTVNVVAAKLDASQSAIICLQTSYYIQITIIT